MTCTRKIGLHVSPSFSYRPEVLDSAVACYHLTPITDAHSPLTTDDPEKYNRAPASFQLLGRRLDEEKLIPLAAIMVEALEEYKKQDGWENM